MEQIDVRLSPFTRRSRSLGLSHHSHGLARGLEPDEHVLLRDTANGDHFIAVVSDIHFDLEDTTYRLTIGSRITEEESVQWRAPSTDGELLTTSDMVALLAALNRSQRVLSTSLTDLLAH